jgi:hypothetical protein
MEDIRAVLDDDNFAVIEVAKALNHLADRAGRDYKPLTRLLDAVLFFRDDAGHQNERRTIAKIINRAGISQLEPVIEEFASSLSTKLSSLSEYDAVKSFADPLSQYVMAHILGLSAADMQAVSNLLAGVTQLFDLAQLPGFDRLNVKVRRALELLESRISEAIAHNAANGLSIIYDSTEGSDSERLEQAAATALFAYLVGSETSAALIGSLIRTLVEQPSLRELGHENPSIIPIIVSEVLRLESNVQRVYRVARKSRIIGDKAIQPGERVLLLIGASNRDPVAFAEPDSLRTDRTAIPNVAFGGGRHFCLGASLALLEGRKALEHFLRLPAIELAGEEKWYPGRTVRRLREFPVRVTRRTPHLLDPNGCA